MVQLKLAATEEWNGTSWTNNPTGLGTARYGLGGCGTQTAGLAFGGNTGPGVFITGTEEYNGSTWTTSGGPLNRAGNFSTGSAGIQTAALAFGGYGPGNNAYTEAYNGTSWAIETNMGTTRRYSAGAGTLSGALGAGGYTTTASAATEEWTGAGAPLTQTITTS
jgi:hypothetical protein